jgi:hypothetical protein
MTDEIGIYRTAELAEGWDGELIKRGEFIILLTRLSIWLTVLRGAPERSRWSYDGRCRRRLQYLPHGFPPSPKNSLEGYFLSLCRSQLDNIDGRDSQSLSRRTYI